MKKYKVILADPPWNFETWAEGDRNVTKYYPTMPTDDICKLSVPADDNCALFMWICWPKLIDAFQVGEAWGFTYRTCAFSWTKVTKRKAVHFGMGYWTRANTEACLLFTKGSPKRKSKGVPQVIWENFEEESIIAPFRGHSVKPDEQYNRIESLMDGPYLEMFCRRPRPGWDSWGNEIESDIEIGESKHEATRHESGVVKHASRV